MKHIICIVLFISNFFCAFAQVGINTPNPLPCAALHINGNGKKGLIIPTMDSNQRNGMIDNDATNGLLVYDSDEKIFYFFNETSSKWIALNPLQADDGSADTIKLSATNKGDIIIVNNSMTVTENLTVTGAAALQATLAVDKKATFKDTVSVSYLIQSDKNMVAKDTVKASVVSALVINAISGNGITPIGGIIMWSGDKSSIPEGWALCDGKKTSTGYTTPDLRGRFIVGYGENGTDLPYIPSNIWDSQYSQPGNLSTKRTVSGNKGGAKEVILTGRQMPKHQHFSARVNGDDKAEGNYYLSSTRTVISVDGITKPQNAEGETGYSGNNEPHENRPPYYVLAFIMRVQ